VRERTYSDLIGAIPGQVSQYFPFVSSGACLSVMSSVEKLRRELRSEFFYFRSRKGQQSY